MLRRCLLLALPLLLLLPLGCQKAGPVVAQVSGRIMIDDGKTKKPLAGARIIFEPLDKGPDGKPLPPSQADTDAEGAYKLTLTGDRGSEGAVVGPHTVRISLIERGNRLTNKIPDRYNTHSDLRYTVPPDGSTDADFQVRTR
jgi:hypothetical protein